MNEKSNELIQRIKELEKKLEQKQSRSLYDWIKDIIIPLLVPLTVAWLTYVVSVSQRKASEQQAFSGLRIEHLKLIFNDASSDDQKKQQKAILFLRAINDKDLENALNQWLQSLKGSDLLSGSASRTLDGLSSTSANAPPPQSSPSQVQPSPSGVGLRKSTVYIQVPSNASNQSIKKLASTLKSQGYTVPGVEKISFKFSNSIRYYNPQQDNQMASRLQGDVIQFLKEINGSGSTIEIQNLHKRYPNVQSDVIELWINL